MNTHFDIGSAPQPSRKDVGVFARAMRHPARVGVKMFALELGILALVVIPAASYAAFTIDKSISTHTLINTSSSGWYDRSYTYCRKLTTTAGGDVGGVATTTTASYTLFASTTLSTLKTTGNGGHIQLENTFTGSSSSTPKDIVITDGTDCNTDGGTKLPFYVEDYASTTGAIALWVAADGVSSTTAKSVLLYYGDSSATNQENKTGANGTNGAAGVWTFGYPDLQTNVQDTSGSGKNASLVNYISTTTVAGELGRALAFSSANSQYAIASQTPATDPPLAGSAWIYSTAYNGTFTIVNTSPGTGGTPQNFGWRFQTSSTGQVTFVFGRVLEYDSGLTVSANKWNYVAFSINANNGKIDFYVNGAHSSVSIGTINNSSPPQATTIGVDMFSSLFNGDIDDLRVYNRKIDAMDFLTNYNMGKNSAVFWTWGAEETQTVSGGNALKLWYTFDGADLASNVADKSGNGATGYLQSFSATTTAPGRIGGGLSFNGTSNYVSEPSSISSIKSVSFWAKATSGASQGLINLTSSSVYISTNASKALSATGFTSPTYYLDGVASSSPGLYDSQWHHVVVTGTASITGSQIEVGRANGTYFGGSIDDVRLYSSTLSASDVKRLYGLGGTTYIDKSLNTESSLQNGLVGWWTFDGSNLINNVTDSSGQENNGALVGFTSTSTAVVPGKLGQALDFHGVDDEVAIPSSSSLNPSGAMSFSFWANGVWSGSNFNRVLQKGQGSSDVGYGCAWSGANKVDCWHTAAGGSPEHVQGMLPPSANVWHHVVVVYDGASTITIYLDGVDVTTTAGSLGYGATNTDLALGGRAGATNQPFNGSLDDVRVYNRALSASEVQRLYGIGAAAHIATTPNSGSGDALGNGLMGHWTFDGPDLLQNVADTSGSGNTGFLQGFTSTSTAVVPGKLGQALSFNGSDYIVTQSTTVGDFGTSDFSIGLWLKANTTASNPQIIAKRAICGHGDFWNLRVSSAGKLTAEIDDGNTNYNAFNSVGTIADSSWHYIVVTRAGATLAIYIDGAFDSSNSTAGTTNIGANGTPIRVGNSGTGSATCDVKYAGSLDDVRVYNRALSAAEIKRLYQQGL